MDIKNKKKYWKIKIISALENENILWFIIEEIWDSLEYLNVYKIKNVYENLDSFVNRIKLINENYIKAISKSF